MGRRAALCASLRLFVVIPAFRETCHAATRSLCNLLRSQPESSRITNPTLPFESQRGAGRHGPLRELKQVFLRVLGFAFCFGEGFDAVGGVFELLTRQQFRDGEDLEAGIAARKFFGLVEACRRCSAGL